jgi:hypothetical protein
LPESEAAWIKLNEAFPSDPNAAHLPSIYACLTGRTDNAGALRRRVYHFAKLWLDPTWEFSRTAPGPTARRFRHHSRGKRWYL